MAVVDGTVTVVEPAALADKIAELGALEAKARPVDLRDRTGPWLVVEPGSELLAKGTVELGVVGDDEIGVLDEGGTAPTSMDCPATISAVMPVILMISSLISTVGSRNAENMPTTSPITPSVCTAVTNQATGAPS
jgi:hypothetical protein